MDDMEIDTSLGDFGVSLADLRWLSEQLCIEYSRKHGGDKIAPASVLKNEVGCSYTAARMWLSGEAVPRRAVFINKIINLIEVRYPKLQIRITKADAALFDMVVSELEVAMGPHGSHLAFRIKKELERCRIVFTD